MDEFSIFLDHVFNHMVCEPAWYWLDDVEPLAISSDVSAAYISRLFCHANSLLDRYSDSQIAQGFWYLMPVVSIGDSYIDSVTDVRINYQLREAVIASIWPLYRDFFNHRCQPRLSNDAGGDISAYGPINSICYIFWDVLFTCHLSHTKDDRIIIAALNVLELILSLDNVACQESALHGLGHIPAEHKSTANLIIDRYLSIEMREIRLHKFAIDARRGIV